MISSFEPHTNAETVSMKSSFFRKMSKTFNYKFATETYLADGELVQVLENREEILKLRRRSLIPVASKDVGQHFYLHKHVCKIKIKVIIMVKNQWCW